MRIIIPTITLLLIFCSAIAQEQKHVNIDKNGLAIGGFDPVSYFISGKPMEGTKKYTISYGGAIYYFVSDDNKNRFRSDPLKYIPAYGGWCAFAMGDYGEKVKVDPQTFKIVGRIGTGISELVAS